MELCIVKHKVKTNNGNSTRKKVGAVMIRKILEQKRTTVVLRFVHYALSSTMESARLYMWQNPVGSRRWCEGPSGGRL